MYRISAPAPGIILIHGDSREVLADVAHHNVLADVIVCDPPYGINYQGSGHRPIEGDDDARVISDWSIAAMEKLMKPNSAMFVCSRDDVAPTWAFAMRANGLKVRAQNIIWDKVYASGTGDARSSFRVRHEPIIVAHKGRPLLRPWTDHGRHFPGKGEKLVLRDEGLWVYPVPKDKLSCERPTPKPPLMFERAILPCTDIGGLVLDPFMGGAPVGVAALWTGRRYIGIEKDSEYFALAVQSLQRAVMQRELCAAIDRLAA